MVALSLGFTAFRLRAAPAARLGRRPGPPGRADRRGRAADLDLARSSGPSACSTPAPSSRPRCSSPSPRRSARAEAGVGRADAAPRGPAGRERLAAGGDGRGGRDRRRRTGRSRRKHAVDAGIFNFDSLWYHMPFSADMVQSHSTDRDAPRRHRLHELVLPAELGAAPRGRDPADRAGHALAVRQLRLARGRLPGRLVRRAGRTGGGISASSPRRSCSSATRWWCASRGRPRTI